MKSHFITILDRPAHSKGARILRSFELVGQSDACAWRAAAEAASTTPGAQGYDVERE